MKIRKVSSWVLRIPFTFPLVREQQHALANFVETETDDGLKMVAAAGAHEHDEILGQTSDESILEDTKRVRALREAVGPDIELMIDANKGATYAQALRLAKLGEPCNLTWFEDPRAAGRSRSPQAAPPRPTPCSCASTWCTRRWISCSPTCCDIGGYTQGLKAAGIAQAFNDPLAMGGNSRAGCAGDMRPLVCRRPEILRLVCRPP